jgi:hypothetical protein
MSTTDPKMAATILDCMAAFGIEFAVLHGEAEVAAGSARSDVDLVTAESPGEILSEVHGFLRSRDIHPVVSWRYDVDSSSVFFSDGAAEEGAQLDLIYGSTGLGNYGLRIEAILDKSEPGDRWPKASSFHELLYSIRKRHLKGQTKELSDLLEMTHELNLGELIESSHEMFSAGAMREVTSILTGQNQGAGIAERFAFPKRFSTAFHRTWSNAARRAGRLREPAGFWVAIQGERAAETADEISKRFARFLPVSSSGAFDGSIAEGIRSYRELIAIRWRAGIYVTFGKVPPLIGPDLTLATDGAQIDQVTARVVDAMQRRLTG